MYGADGTNLAVPPPAPGQTVIKRLVRGTLELDAESADRIRFIRHTASLGQDSAALLPLNAKPLNLQRVTVRATLQAPTP